MRAYGILFCDRCRTSIPQGAVSCAIPGGLTLCQRCHEKDRRTSEFTCRICERVFPHSSPHQLLAGEIVCAQCSAVIEDLEERRPPPEREQDQSARTRTKLLQRPSVGVIAAAAGLLLSFFLPWADAGVATVATYEVPSKAAVAQAVMEKLSMDLRETVPRERWRTLQNSGSHEWLYLIWLFPVAAIGVVSAEFAKLRESKHIALGVGGFVIGFVLVYLIVVLVQAQKADAVTLMLRMLGIGFWGSLAAGIAMFVAAGLWLLQARE